MTAELLRHLRSRVGRRGLVMRREAVLLAQLRTTKEVLSRALETLVREGAVAVLSPLPFLVLRLGSWSGSSHPGVKNKQQTPQVQAQLYMEVPVSTAAAAAATHEDGGAGEGEALLGEVLGLLGPEADREEFRRILAAHHPALIRRALGRVAQTKAIKVSRPALFRFLLRKLSHH